MRRTLKYLIDLIAAIAAASVVVLALLIWRLASEPISSSYLTPYVQSGLQYLLPETTSEIGTTLLVWDNADSSIALKGEDVKILDSDKDVLAEFPSIKVKLSVIGLLQGRLIPAELGIENPQLWFERNENGEFSFGGVISNGDKPIAREKTSSAEIISSIQQSINDLTKKGRLHELKVTNAVVTLKDAMSNREWTLKIPEISLNHDDIGLIGQLGAEITRDEYKTALKAQYRFDRDKETHEAAISFSDLNISTILAGSQVAASGIDLPLTGEAKAVFDEKLNVVSTNIKLNGGEGRLTALDLWDEPRALKSLNIAVDYSKEPRMLKISGNGLDFGGPKLRVALDGTAPADGEFDIGFIMNVMLDDLPMDQYAAVWPKAIVPGARDWISSNMSKGMFEHGEIALKGKFKWNDIANMVLESGEGKLIAKKGNVKYIEGAPLVEGVDAEAKFDLNGMDIALSGGGVGALKLQPSTVKITGFQDSVQNADIPVRMLGPIKEVIRIIDAPPLGYAKAIGMRADEVDGNIEGLVDIKLPLLKDIALRDVAIKAEAKLKDFYAKKLIPGIEIAHGNVALDLDQNGFTIKGPLDLNKVTMQVSWVGIFDPPPDKPRYQADITGSISGEQWKLLGIDGMEKPQGSTEVAIKYSQPRSDLSRISGELNFRQAGFVFKQLNWNKAIGTPAALNFAVEIPDGKNIQIKSISLQGHQIKAKGSAVVEGKTGRLINLELKPLVIGRTNANLRISKDKTMTRISAEGEALDISGMESDKNKKPEEKETTDYTVKLDKLYMSESGYIGNVVIHARQDKIGWDEIDLHGMANGESQLYISLLPQLGAPNRRAFSIKCDNFGNLLKGMGFTDTVHKGPITVSGQSSESDPRVIEGDLNIGGFFVSGLPVLARLLNAASPFGFADLVTGETSFDHLQGKYSWHGDTIELQQIRAAGSVFGVNVDGSLNLDDGSANLHGTLVPFSFFNSVINVIPLVGGIITGGEGQGVIAASYTVKGKLEDPDVSVNPVSLLTPGFLRNLFFSEKTEEPAKTD
ncbi:MAG: AsmA-like C-terminal domain-containing protein [Alphaproteobacteria bacterium]|nr:AsmA-like C-terminal domain-containing protein [Alphaproteobacteria bacterium]